MDLLSNRLFIQTSTCWERVIYRPRPHVADSLFSWWWDRDSSVYSSTGLCFYTFNILLVLFVIAGECPQLLFLYLEIFNNLYFIYQQVVFLVNYYYDQLLYELSVRFSLVDLELSLLLPCLTNGFINYWMNSAFTYRIKIINNYWKSAFRPVELSAFRILLKSSYNNYYFFGKHFLEINYLSIIS